MHEQYDVIIVGAGPAGIFCSLELAGLGVEHILILEKGRDISERKCPARETHCVGCRSCDIMTGWGGAGAFSDGKLTLTGDVGGRLGEYVGHESLHVLLEEADAVWLAHGASREVYGPDPQTAARLKCEAALASMRLLPMRIRHLGTDRSPAVLQFMREHLEEMGVEIRTNTSVSAINADAGRITGVELEDGTFLGAKAVVAAPGREGAEWLADQAESLNVGLSTNAVDIGVRVEVPAAVLEPLTDPLYEAKLIHYSRSFDDCVRTFCMNPYGEVTTESYGDVMTVNGHSYAEEKTEYTNFAVLVSQSFTQPFREPTMYGRSIARLANLLGEGILVQRLGDLRAGRRSTPDRIRQSAVVPTMHDATPG